MPTGDTPLFKMKEKILSSQVPTKEVSTNPYLDARREWNERYGDYISSTRRWQTVAFLSLIVAITGVAGVVLIGMENKLVPYVVQVDKLGSALATGRASVALKVDQRVIRAQLARWISDVRSIFVDASAQRLLLKEAYAMVDSHSAAFETLNQYFRQNDPFDKAKTEIANVEVQSALPISDFTWRIEWVEKRLSRQGELLSSQRFQAAITIEINPPDDEAVLLINPMGVYISNFSWAPII